MHDNGIENFIKDITPGKATGPDYINGEVIKIMFYTNRKLFQEILNSITEKGLFPDYWKYAKIALIPKDKDLSLPSGY